MKLRKKVPLTWDNPVGLAMALWDAHPEVSDVVEMDRADARAMIAGLQGFEDDADPGHPGPVDTVLYLWHTLVTDGPWWKEAV